MTFGATVRAVTRSRLIPSRAALTLTPAAVKKVSDITNRQKCQGLKVSVKTRGCNGLTYVLDYCDYAAKFDEVVEQDGVKIFIDSKALMTLIGTEMDYTSNKLTSEFVFNNPNVKGTCGCGESFSV
ncbi:hypothetical protein ACHWQZ_G017074 [Mnemiopsis leidyi]